MFIVKFHRKVIPLFLVVSLLFLASRCTPTVTLPHPSPADYPVLPDASLRNVILLIGDGMGLSQITVGRLRTMGITGKLSIEKMPVTGYLHTHSADNLITDSAAGATALATGYKTNNKRIATLPDGSAVITILECFRDRGMATGLVATSSITHATPASFAAHVDSRYKEPIIAEQLINSRVNVLLGGGKQFFIPKADSNSKRPDSLNLIRIAQQKGYRVVETREALQKIHKPNVLGLFQYGGLNHADPEPTLAEMTRKSIDLLRQNPNGFFLMVEGSQIDWGGHNNDLEYVIREMLAFDEAVKAALEFAAKDKHTLVIVTADHETGGLAITGGSTDGKQLEVEWANTHHTAQPVPLFAFGPYSLLFTGVHENNTVPLTIARLMGFENFPGKIEATLPRVLSQQ